MPGSASSHDAEAEAEQDAVARETSQDTPYGEARGLFIQIDAERMMQLRDRYLASMSSPAGR